ncbi:polyprenyl synthetase family protein [Bacillus lacus]|uniref:Farnesyl diphosphate synthase n=1 Tax=Metabacillus lacus TaxID=1983721 RepID=A0A7X2M0H8_9BACI|nr:polyprenyl synthetase family protein [Metabacillus lacus]
MPDFLTFLETRKQLIEDKLPSYIEELKAPSSLKSSMNYSLQAGGKRLRPVLLLAVLNAYGKDESIGVDAACAVEMIHTYSLIHDDLPCMDDDDLRRGKPTNHKVYGEALAVLAGDGLLTQSFALLAESGNRIPAEIKVRLISELVKASGAEGMAGGQVADMEGESAALTLEQLQYIHEHKTARLLQFSAVAGGILSDAPEADIKKLREFAFHIGIAFQIKDDLLDIEGIEEKIGKPVGSDSVNEKTTYPSLLAADGAREKLNEHIEKALNLLKSLNIDSFLLKGLCRLVAERDH